MKTNLSLIALLTILFCGCRTPPTHDQIVAAAAVLKSTTQAAATYAISQDSRNTNYFTIAADALSVFVTGKDYTPGALASSLSNLPVDSLKNPWVQLAIAAATDLYTLYWNELLPGVVDRNEAAKLLITAVQDGFNAALGRPVSRVYAPLTMAPRIGRR